MSTAQPDPACEDCPDLLEHLDDDDDGDDDGGDWLEVEDEPVVPCLCLFCEQTWPTPAQLFCHCAEVHDFDMRQVVETLCLDCYGYIKMINYIRSQKVSAVSIVRRVAGDKLPWDTDQFMQPVNPDDPLLQYDLDDISEDMSSVVHQAACGHSEPQTPASGMPTLTQYTDLVHRLREAENKARLSEENLERALHDLNTIREKTQQLMLSQSVGELQMPSAGQTDTQTPEAEGDDPYFSSYGHFSIHEEMLKDRVRTESYRDCMYKNRDVFRDKIVLDVGCGTGILSMFAAQAGAKHVYAVDMAEIIYQAMDIARENNLEDKITFFRGKLEDITLPVQKVDIIVSEWMGYFLLFESMLDSILYARSKYLQHDGVVYPDKCSISLAGISDTDLYSKHVSYWDDVYGFKMTCMKTCVVREASVEVINKDTLATNSCVVKELDIGSCKLCDLQFSSHFKLTVSRDCDLTAIIGYFDIFFHKHCTNKVEFSTGPHVTPTHWKQTVFLLDEPLSCHAGDELAGGITCRKNRKDPRSLIISLSFGGKTLTYYME